MNSILIGHPRPRARAALILALALVGAVAVALAQAGGARADGPGNPSVNFSPNSGPVGTTVTVIGNSFNKGDTVVIGYSPNSKCTNPTTVQGAQATADGNGNVNIPFQFPNATAGSYYICATDQQSGHTTASSTPFSVVAQAALTVSQPVYSGQTVTVTGKGYQAPSGASGSNGTVDIHYGAQGSNGCATAAATATVGSDGSFTATFTAPHETSPTPIVIAGVEPTGVCGTTKANFSATSNVTDYPMPTLAAPTSVASGATIKVTGQNYWPANSTVQLLYGASGTDGCANVIGTTTSGADGTITDSFKAPNESSSTTITIAGVEPVGGCSTSPIKAQAETAITAPTPPINFPIQWCLIGLLLLLLLLLLLFLVFRGRGPAPVTVEERDTVVVPPGGGGSPSAGAYVDRQIIARQGGKQVVIAEEITTVEEELEDATS